MDLYVLTYVNCFNLKVFKIKNKNYTKLQTFTQLAVQINCNVKYMKILK